VISCFYSEKTDRCRLNPTRGRRFASDQGSLKTGGPIGPALPIPKALRCWKMVIQGGNQARFNGRVESYKRFRPSYPTEILDLLTRECGLTPESTVVDVAAGTGLFSELFLQNGNTVLAIEPNDEMRAVCQERQISYPRLRVQNGTAEATGVKSGSADFLTVAQAMHWFNLKRAREEFARVLRPNGWCVVAYNERRLGGDPFHDGLEEIHLKFGPDYRRVLQQHLGEDQARAFFAPFPMRRRILPNAQLLDLDALVGRIVSSSYMPTSTHGSYTAMRHAIEKLFDENQRDGFVRLEYDCSVSYGRFA
jgi:SAM-dependent methyltransferase